jgi:acetyl esterase
MRPTDLTLDPDTQRMLDMLDMLGSPRLETLPPAMARAAMARAFVSMAPRPEEVAECRALTAPGPIGLRLYRPAGAAPDALLPALLFCHGGGWVLGDLDSHDAMCRALCNRSGGIVVAVDYRLAPEHPFPAGIEDAYAALRFVAGSAPALGIDAGRLAVGGDSAGGNLAAVLALLARDDPDAPRLCFQLLLYPVTDLSLAHDSHRRNGEGYLLTATAMRWYRDLYLADPAAYENWRASPLRAPDLAGLPASYVATAGCDVLHDEGVAYAEALAAAGVPVTLRDYPGQIHGFMAMGRVIPSAIEALSAAGAALHAAWNDMTAGTR